MSRRSTHAGLRLTLLGATLCAPLVAAADPPLPMPSDPAEWQQPPPYAPDRWSTGPGRLEGVAWHAIDDEFRLVLAFEGPGRLETESGQRVTLWFGPAPDPVDLPDPKPPVLALRVVDARLAVDLPLGTTWRAASSPDGWNLDFGRQTRRAPLRLTPGTTDTFTLSPSAGSIRQRLDTAARALATGDHVTALATFAALDAGGNDDRLRASARFQSGVALESAGLPLLALGAYVEVLAVPRTALGPKAAAAIDRVRTRHPGALALVSDDLRRASRIGSTATWLTFEAARLRLRFAAAEADEQRRTRLIEEAAHLLLDVRDEPAWAHRARHLMGLAAQLAGQLGWARQHFLAVAHRTDDLRLRGESLLAAGRVAYESGALGEAREALLGAARLPSSRGAAHRTLAWLSLKEGMRPEELIERLTPLNIAAEGPAHALMLGYLYQRTCHPMRAASLASAVLVEGTVARSPLAAAIARERQRLAAPSWEPIRDVLTARLDGYAKAQKGLELTDYALYLRRRALRLRTSADQLRVRLLEGQLRGDRTSAEPDAYRLRNRRFVESSTVVDRCALLGQRSSTPEAR